MLVTAQLTGGVISLIIIKTAHYNKAVSKFNKIDKKYQKKQRKSDKQYAKAEKRLNSFWYSDSEAKEAFDRAAKLQSKANKVVYKGKKWYDAMEKSFGKEYLKKMDPSLIDRGQDFAKRVKDNSAMMYAVSVHEQMSRK